MLFLRRPEIWKKGTLFQLTSDDKLQILTQPSFHKGTQGFIHCLFKAASLATLNKRMLPAFATHDALSLVITKPNFIWFGSTTVDICATLENSC